MASDDPGEELRVLRERVADMEALLSRMEAFDFTGGQSLAVKTTTINTYPVAAYLTTYAVIAEDVSGAEAEGDTATLTDRSEPFLAVNLGTEIPPVNTPLVVMLVPYAYVFRYDTPP